MKNTSKKTIVYYSDCPFFGGSETMLPLFFNSDRLRSKFKILFVYADSPEYSSGLNQRLVKPIIRIPIKQLLPGENNIESNKFRKWFADLIRILVKTFFRYPLMVLQILKLQKIFRTFRPDILHVNNGGYPGARSALAAVIAGRIAGVPNIILVVNNIASGYSDIQRWFDYPFDRLVARYGDRFITGSKAASIALTSVLNISKSKSFAVYNGIDLGIMRSSVADCRSKLGVDKKSVVVFGTVGLLVERKGHKTLIDSVQILKQNSINQLVNVIFIVIGDGPLRGDLEVYVRANNLTDLIKFVGHQPHPVDIMSAIDILVFPSISHEDFPNVILESMASGKPVIASKIAGTTEQVIDGETGFLFDAGNASQLADAFDRIISNNETRLLMGIAARNRYNKMFTAEQAVNRYIDLYNNCNDL